MVGGKSNKLKFEFCSVATFGRVIQRKREKGVLETWAKQGSVMGQGIKRPVSFPE